MNEAAVDSVVISATAITVRAVTEQKEVTYAMAVDPNVSAAWRQQFQSSVASAGAKFQIERDAIIWTSVAGQSQTSVDQLANLLDTTNKSFVRAG